MMLLVAAAIGLLAAQAGERAADLAPPLAIVGAEVLDLEHGELLGARTVLVEGGRIARIGPAAELAVPPGHQRIEARGRLLMPGLVDLAVGLGDGGELALYLAHGVTAVRALDGGDAARQLAEELERGERAGPRLFLGEPLAERELCALLPEPCDELALTRAAAALAADGELVTTGLAGLVALAREARGEPAELPQAVDPVTRTLWDPAGRGLRRHVDAAGAPALERRLAAALPLLRAARAAGARVLPASDALRAPLAPGRGLLRELSLWERAGVARAELLRAATLEAWRALGEPGEGALREGARADLLLLDGDPRADLAHLERPAGVVVRGRWIAREELDALLAEAAARNDAARPYVEAVLEPRPGLAAFTESFAPRGEWDGRTPPVRPELARLALGLAFRAKSPGDARELAEYAARAWPAEAWAQLALAEQLAAEGERRRPRALARRALELRPRLDAARELLDRLGPEPPPLDAAPDDADWAGFRGPGGAGVAEVAGLPRALDPERNRRWRTPLPSGYSSPALFAGRVFVTAHEGPRALTYCLDRANGEVLWSVRAPGRLAGTKRERKRSASASAAVDARGVHVFFESFGLFAYDLEGRERWRLPLGPFVHTYGHASSPVLAGELLLLQCDHDDGSYLLAVDVATGAERWRAPRPHAGDGFATPVLYRPEGAPAEVICSGSYRVSGFALATGELLWWADGMASVATTIPSVVGDRLYVHSWMHAPRQLGADRFEVAWPEALATFDADADGRLSHTELEPLGLAYAWAYHDRDHDEALDEREWERALARTRSENGLHALRLGGRGDVTASHVEWSCRKRLPNTASPLVHGGICYLLTESGVLTALDARTGAAGKSGRLGDGGDSFYASPVAGDGLVYVASHAGGLFVLRAGAEWEILAERALGETVFATPALAPGRVYVRSEDALHCFEGAGP